MFRHFLGSTTVLTLGLLLAACQTGYRANAPESLYSKNATEARTLQVPPDLTDVSNGEQFVLPGNTGGAITRNTLLPETASVRFVREKTENWLEIKRAPEDVWPQLQAFLRAERYPVAQTEPTAGVMSSQWRESNDAGASRVAFRLERGDANTTRLFARRQVAASKDVKIGPDDVWPTASHDAENTSELLVRLMVFLGVQEQRARGILSDKAVSSVLDDATLEATASDTWLVVHRGFRPALHAVSKALQGLSENEVSVDQNVGRVNATLEGAAVAFRITPVNVSAARVTVSAAEPLTRKQQEALLAKLRDQLV